MLLLLSACPRAPNNFTWVDDFKDDGRPNNDYLIVPGDVLNVRVFQQENMSARVRVRNDGKVSLPFLHDVDAAGYSPVVFAEQLQTRLKDFINNPVVTVSLEEVKPLPISVLGEVLKPGLYNLEPPAGVLQALASAGGFTEFARKDSVFVLRHPSGASTVSRIRFSYAALSQAQGRAAAFTLATGDVVLVE